MSITAILTSDSPRQVKVATNISLILKVQSYCNNSELRTGLIPGENILRWPSLIPRAKWAVGLEAGLPHPGPPCCHGSYSSHRRAVRKLPRGGRCSLAWPREDLRLLRSSRRRCAAWYWFELGHLYHERHSTATMGPGDHPPWRMCGGELHVLCPRYLPRC